MVLTYENLTVYLLYFVSRHVCLISWLFYLSVTGYLQCIDSDTAALVQTYSLQIQTLSYSQAIHPVVGGDTTIPQGCAVAIASDKCTVHLMLKVKVFKYVVS